MHHPGRVRSVTGHTQAPLGKFRIWATPPGALRDPSELANAGEPLVVADAPCTAASALRAAGLFDLERSKARRFDGEDWWFQTRFVSPEIEAGDERALVLDGLATLSDVWIDGAHVLASESMFVRHEVPLASAGEHELVMRFRSLDAALAARRPSPRWRVPMVENQKLRFFRTTLLGRTPGWSPPVPPVGPSRDLFVVHRRAIDVDDVRLGPRIEGNDGVLAIDVRVRALGHSLGEITVELSRNGTATRTRLAKMSEDRFAAELRIPNVDRWWPHTHGEPALYAARLVVIHDRGTSEIDLGGVGFRWLRVDTHDGNFRVEVNDARVFCRGAVWTPLDPVGFTSNDLALASAFDQITSAGMNMLRVSGAIGPESDAFLEACDAQGVLLWQDFAFANFDYPDQDPAFRALAEAEVRQELARLSGRASLAVLCGASENEQQAAMWGASRERWSPELTHALIPSLVRELAPDAFYWPSSAHGGAFPHQASAGTTSYYGVGAYRRPLDDARRAEVRFASECLAFANVPSDAGLAGGASTRAHHPAWKARSPRDLGAGWDFDDVRDHYLALLFGVDATSLRSTDHDRYLALSRVVSGEVMAAVFAEWRRRRSTCGGGLIWFLRDLWAGAGWGVVEANGAPKAALAYLARALRPTSIAITDEGVNGLAIQITNDGPLPLEGELVLGLFRDGEIPVGNARSSISIAPHEAIEVAAASLLEGFVDLSYAYRFGPPPVDLVVATLRVGDRTFDAFHLPLGLGLRRERDLGLTASARKVGDDYQLILATRRFAQSISIEAPGYAGEDDWFHLAPGTSRVVLLRALTGAAALRGSVRALNAESSVAIAVTS